MLAAWLSIGTAACACAQGTETTDLMTSLGLWTNVPEAKEFVRRTRPASETLDFRSPYATDLRRPPARDPAGVQSLERNLERAGARNRSLAGKGTPPPAAATAKPAATR